MKITNIILGLLLCLSPSLATAGTAYYVDCSAGTNGNGSYSSPWNNILSVNSHTFSTGDDVYFRVNTTCVASAALRIDWLGTPEDRAIIGAYHGENQFGLGGNARPAIDGNNHTVPTRPAPGQPTNYGSLISARGTVSADDQPGFLTIQDLKVQNSGDWGIRISDLDHVEVKNCWVFQTWGVLGIEMGRVHDGLIENNILQDCNYRHWHEGEQRGAGGVIQYTHAQPQPHSATMSRDGVVRGNWMNTCGSECIANYDSDRIVIEHNTIFDQYNQPNVAIYVSGFMSETVVRYNHLAGASDGLYNPWIGIAIGTEDWQCEVRTSEWNIYDAQIYGNLVANYRYGVKFYMQGGSSGCVGVEDDHKNINIFNNTLVNNEFNLGFAGTQEFIDIEIKNNLSYTVSADSSHVDQCSIAGVSWTHNLFDDDPGGGECQDGMISGAPLLQKTTGWHNISTELGFADFRTVVASSPAIDAGIHLTTVDSTDDCNGSSGCDATIAVANSHYFTGAHLTTLNIAVGSPLNVTTVTRVDHSTGIVTVNPAVDRDGGDGIWIVMADWGNQRQRTDAGYYGAGIDVGAIEYAADLAPTLVSPVDGAAGVSAVEPIVLRLSRNARANHMASHAQSHWRTCTDEGCGHVVWSSLDDASNRTSISIPAGTLTADTTYYWQAATQSDDGTYGDVASPWATTSAFTTSGLPGTRPSPPTNLRVLQ